MGLLIASPRARASSPPGNSNGRRAIYTYKPAAAAICRVLLFCCANACNWSSEGRLKIRKSIFFFALGVSGRMRKA